jgi:hypothetical protein
MGQSNCFLSKHTIRCFRATLMKRPNNLADITKYFETGQKANKKLDIQATKNNNNTVCLPQACDKLVALPSNKKTTQTTDVGASSRRLPANREPEDQSCDRGDGSRANRNHENPDDPKPRQGRPSLRRIWGNIIIIWVNNAKKI